MARPYIGIVGVKDMTEALMAATIVDLALQGAKIPHQPQIGVQVTDRTLRGEATESKRNPPVSEIPLIFAAALRVRRDILTVVHYTTKDPARLRGNVDAIMNLGDMYASGLCKGLQLNQVFGNLDPENLAHILEVYPDLQIILQVPKGALKSMSVDGIIAELKKFDGLANYALIDPSGGCGEEMDVDAGITLAAAIMEKTAVAPALAGGLTGDNVGDIIPRIRKGLGTDLFSVDAERGLRDKLGEGYGNDRFNPVKTEWYSRNTVAAFK